jgi:hypothetical protein
MQLIQRPLGHVITSTRPSATALPGARVSGAVNSWFPFIDGIKPPHQVKVIHSGRSRSEIEISVVVLDRGKGLKESVATVFPSANHRFYLRHLVANMKNKF